MAISKKQTDQLYSAANLLVGGHHQYATYAEMVAIPTRLRKAGMLATVYDNAVDVTLNGTYVLDKGLVTFVPQNPASRFNYRGPWQPATSYAPNDVVNFNGSTYYRDDVTFTSSTYFDKNNWKNFTSSFYNINWANDPVVITGNDDFLGAPQGNVHLIKVAKVYLYDVLGAIAFNAQNAATRLIGRTGYYKNTGSTSCRLVAYSGNLIDGAVELILAPGEYVLLQVVTTGFAVMMRGNGSQSTYDDTALKIRVTAVEVGKADLVGGVVPASQLPSYVDDVIEVSDYSALPAIGENGKIYIAIDTNYTYRWGGSAYAQVGGPIPVAENTAFIFQVGSVAASHYHIAKLSVEQTKYLVENARATVDIVSDVVEGHQHTITLRFNELTHNFDVLNVTHAGSVVHVAYLIGNGEVSQADLAIVQGQVQNFFNNLNPRVFQNETSITQLFEQLYNLSLVRDFVYVPGSVLPATPQFHKLYMLNDGPNKYKLYFYDGTYKLVVGNATGGGTIDESNLVHRTGNELVSGIKTIEDSIVLSSDSATQPLIEFPTRGITDGFPTKIGFSVGTDYFLTASVSGGGFKVINNYPTAVFVVQSNGKVGIGTDSPTEKLQVTGSVKANFFIGDGSQLTNLPGSQPARVDATLRAAIVALAFASGESSGTAPTGSAEGMKFADVSYRYEYMYGMNDTLVWVRTVKA